MTQIFEALTRTRKATFNWNKTSQSWAQDEISALMDIARKTESISDFKELVENRKKTCNRLPFGAGVKRAKMDVYRIILSNL